MARKRKIPARKHHGIRDPLKQQEQTEKKLAKVTNNPPEKSDEQKLSFRFKQFQHLAQAAKSGKKLKLGEIGKEDKPKSSTAAANNSKSNAARQIRQFAEETDEDYLKRVNRITSASVREAQYEAKYGVNVLRNSKTGEITIQKRPKNEIDELLKQKQKEQRLSKMGRKKKQQQLATKMDPKTSKELIKQAYREAKQEELEASQKQDQNATPLEYKRDTFAFGETVHAPPTLKTLPRKATKNETVPRPGRKGNLLLSSLLDPAQQQQEQTPTTKAKSTVSHQTPTKMQLKGKRKDLPLATRNMLEVERGKMVELYRQLKKKTAKE